MTSLSQNKSLPIVDAFIFHAKWNTSLRINGRTWYVGAGHELLLFKCPWCRCFHVHGSPGLAALGTIVTRGSHCQAAIDAGVNIYALKILSVQP